MCLRAAAAVHQPLAQRKRSECVWRLVEIAARAENGNAIVEVKDFGAGIPAGNFDRVWEPLFTTKAEGTGLGLPIARQIATAHAGALTLESNPSAGTVARVSLPLTSCAGN